MAWSSSYRSQRCLGTHDLARALADSLWPSEIAALQASSRDLHAACTSWSRDPASMIAALWLVEKAVVAAGLRGLGDLGAAVVAATLQLQGLKPPWPSWRDGIFLLRCCGDAAHAEGSALRYAVRTGNVHAVSWLLADRADPGKAIASEDLTPLRWVAREGNDDLARMLLDHGAAVNAGGRYGYTALMTAAMHGRSAMVDLLLAARADVNTNDDGETALDLAAKYPDILARLEGRWLTRR